MTKTTEYLTAREAAQRVGVTRAAVYARIDSGKLRQYHSYGRYILRTRDIEAWITERTTRRAA